MAVLDDPCDSIDTFSFRIATMALTGLRMTRRSLNPMLASVRSYAEICEFEEGCSQSLIYQHPHPYLLTPSCTIFCSIFFLVCLAFSRILPLWQTTAITHGLWNQVLFAAQTRFYKYPRFTWTPLRPTLLTVLQ
jgi:hypothetical protein